MPNIVIRDATLAELPLAAELWNAMTTESLDQNWDVLYPNWRSIYLDALRSRMNAGLHRWFVAESDDAVAGIAGAEVFESFFGCVRGYVDGVYVVPAYRRRGIGARLMVACNEWLRAERCDVVRLQATEAGRPLYEYLGFAPTGEMELSLNRFKFSFAQAYKRTDDRTGNRSST